jgi:hypothetical protein
MLQLTILVFRAWPDDGRLRRHPALPFLDQIKPIEPLVPVS